MDGPAFGGVRGRGGLCGIPVHLLGRCPTPHPSSSAGFIVLPRAGPYSSSGGNGCSGFSSLSGKPFSFPALCLRTVMSPRIPIITPTRMTRMTMRKAVVFRSSGQLLPPLAFGLLDEAAAGWLLVLFVVEGIGGSSPAVGIWVLGVRVTVGLTPFPAGDTGVAFGPAAPVPVATTWRLSPGVRGCVSSTSKSASAHRICIAGPTVTAAPAAVPACVHPHTPPRKSVVSVVQLIPMGTQYATVSPGITAGKPSAVLVFARPHPGPTMKPRGHIAGE